jgi:hypothetical protein
MMTTKKAQKRSLTLSRSPCLTLLDSPSDVELLGLGKPSQTNVWSRTPPSTERADPAASILIRTVKMIEEAEAPSTIETAGMTAFAETPWQTAASTLTENQGEIAIASIDL